MPSDQIVAASSQGESSRSPAKAPLSETNPETIVPEPALSTPIRLRRASVRDGERWDLPRSFVGYSVVDPSNLSVRGAAPKCMIVNDVDPNDWFMAKGAEKWGAQETYTEFFINRLGHALGFPMAHSGLVRVDGELRFISRNFLKTGESLTHGSIILESFFGELGKVGKNAWDEQRTYDVEMIEELLKKYCGTDYDRVIAGLVEMLVFDALTGSMDRHMQNWGVVVTTTEPRKQRFAPIFDSARALFWDYTEARLQRIIANKHALGGYANRARPKVGCARFGKAVNHFALCQYLINRFPRETGEVVPKVTVGNVRNCVKILREYPFNHVFTPLRREAILRVLELRAERISVVISQKGEDHV